MTRAQYGVQYRGQHGAQYRGQYDEFLQFAHTLADAAREVTLGYFRRHLDIESKADASPVTIADKATEALLRQRIGECYPDHGIIGEEQAQKASGGDYQWILDPIDGTRNFISGYPLYGTLIGLLKNGRPVVSVIDIPAQDERFSATADTTAEYTKASVSCPIHSASTEQLASAVLFSTDYSMFSDDENRCIEPLRQAVSMVRYNGDCYLYAMLAAGWIDVVVEADLKVYDFLPLTLVVEQAGGIISDWQGQPLDKDSNGQVLAAANATLHQAALALIEKK